VSAAMIRSGAAMRTRLVCQLGPTFGESSTRGRRIPVRDEADRHGSFARVPALGAIELKRRFKLVLINAELMPLSASVVEHTPYVRAVTCAKRHELEQAWIYLTWSHDDPIILGGRQDSLACECEQVERMELAGFRSLTSLSSKNVWRGTLIEGCARCSP
jgi:hypothetical protein